jgi:hypothetical protein
MCQGYNFRVQYTIPSGYASIKQFDWYVNGVFIKTTTQTSTINGVIYGVTELVVNNPDAKFVCRVIYQTSQGVASNPYASEEFVILADAFGFIMDGPTGVNVGSQTVSYVLIPNGGLGTYIPPAGSYTVNWTGPAGWTLSSVTNSGLNASFTTDQTSGGTVKAIITLNGGCHFWDDKEINVTRVLPSLSINGPSNICSSVDYNIGEFPGCGSVTTYTWTKSSNLNLSGGGNTISVTPVSGSAGPAWIEVTASSNCGTVPYRKDITIETSPSITGGHYTSAAPGYGDLSPGINVICGLYTNPTITFNLQGANEISNVQVSGTAPIPAWSFYGNIINFDGFYEEGQVLTFTVTVANSCGSNTYDYTFYQSNCQEQSPVAPLAVYPNPASNQITINLKNIKEDTKTKCREIRQITILDKFGNVKKINKYPSYPSGTLTTTINISDLPNDVYIIEVSDGSNKVKTRLSKTR